MCVKERGMEKERVRVRKCVWCVCVVWLHICCIYERGGGGGGGREREGGREGERDKE